MSISTVRKSILIVTRNFPPEICGVGDHSMALLRILPKWGIEVNIFTKDNVGVRDFVYREKIQNQVFMGDWGNRLSFYKNIKTICKEKAITLIFWQYVPYAFSKKGLPIFLSFIMLALRFGNLNHVIYFHEIAIRRKKRGFRKFIWSCMQRCVAWTMASISQKRITNSVFHQQYLHPYKSHLVSVGANVLPSSNVPSVEKEGMLKIFAFTSRITVVMLNAISEACLRKGVAFSLTIAGRSTSTELAQLQLWLDETQLANFTRLYGVLTNNELSQLMNACDLFVHAEPEDYAGEGGVSTKNGTVIAAMAMAKPIISTVGDLTDQNIFVNGQNIVLVKYSDQKAWEVAIETVLDSDYRTSLGRQAFETWRLEFDWEIVSKKIASVVYGA